MRAPAVADDVTALGDVTTLDLAADKAALLDLVAGDVTAPYMAADDVTAPNMAADDVMASTSAADDVTAPPWQPILSLDVIALDTAAGGVALAAF